MSSVRTTRELGRFFSGLIADSDAPADGTRGAQLTVRGLRLCYASRPILRRICGTLGILMPMEERELHFSEEQPLIAWRLFRVRQSESGFVLSAPLIHNLDFERFPSRTIEAICYEAEHPAPAAGCRCGLYTAIDGTLDSLSGYLIESAHDRDPPIYAAVACTGRVFVDQRGARAQRIEVLRLATSVSMWPDARMQAQAVAELSERYGVEMCDLGVVPEWVIANMMPQGAPPEDAAIDVDALVRSPGLRLPCSR